MLQKIKKELEKLGYNTHVRIINNQKCLYSFIEGNINSVFFIKDKSKKHLLEYFNAQIPVEKEFEKVDELINFIKDKFPIN